MLGTCTEEPQEAHASVSAPLLILILFMLIVGTAMDNSGAAQLIVDAPIPWFSDLPPLALLFVLYFLTQILTKLLSNNTVAVIVTPLAITLGQNLGLDPVPWWSRHVRSDARLRNLDRLSDEHHGLCTRRLQVYRLYPDRAAAEHLDRDHGLPAHPNDLAPLKGLVGGSIMADLVCC